MILIPESRLSAIADPSFFFYLPKGKFVQTRDEENTLPFVCPTRRSQAHSVKSVFYFKKVREGKELGLDSYKKKSENSV